MKDPGTKVISFPSPVPSKADYQRVKSSYSIKEIKQLFGLSEKTLRRWTEQGIIQASSTSQAPDYVYDFNALTQFRPHQSRARPDCECARQFHAFVEERSAAARSTLQPRQSLLRRRRSAPREASLRSCGTDRAGILVSLFQSVACLSQAR